MDRWRLAACVSAFVLLASVPASAQDQATMTAASVRKVPDTGQTLHTTSTFGEDADYTINPPSFTDNADGTITDNVTGLMWQKVDNGESTWEKAIGNASSVATGGYKDWRLPTPNELFCLLNHNNVNPALNTTYFPNNPAGTADYWWTSDLYAGSTTNVWCANAGGGLGPKPKSETIGAGGTLRYNARYVRGASPSNGHNYTNNNDGTITDDDTGLMWSQVPGAPMAWDAAIGYAEGLVLAGYSDWRLPNVKELQTLTDYTLASATTASGVKPSLNRILFPAATATAYWSSTSLRTDTTRAWVVEFGISTTSNPQRNAQGIISYDPKTTAHPLFAVRTASTAAAPVSAFTFTPSGPVAGAAVVFSDESTNAPAAWSWSFGDGATSTAQNPSHAYAAAGIYTVSLTVTNAAGTSTTSKTISIVAPAGRRRSVRS